MRKKLTFSLFAIFLALSVHGASWIRTNQLGYLPEGAKVAVFMANGKVRVEGFCVKDVFSGKEVLKGTARQTGRLQFMETTARLDFSELTTEGSYRIEARLSDGSISRSDIFRIAASVYDGTADFVLNYMRQQRCGWNPFMRDSCHTRDGIVVGYVPRKVAPVWAKGQLTGREEAGGAGKAGSGEDLNGKRIDVTGGWHDASDCLQYVTTSANAVYQMMFAYLNNPSAFGDKFMADGTPGKNGIPDIVDEIYWGLQWLDKMNPRPGEMYNQIADDRDHVGMRKPHEDQADYGWGKGSYRPVWYCSGEPQQRGKFLNNSTGVASTAGKYTSAFALGSKVLKPFYPEFAAKIAPKAEAAYEQGREQPGVCQTASVASPYIYEEDNWTDDMELGAIELWHMSGDPSYRAQAIEYARREPVTPWMGADSARHYQWYPFVNLGHYALAKEAGGKISAEFVRNMRDCLERIRLRGKDDPFFFGIPGIWCSNNLTAAALTECILYRRLTGDKSYLEMEASLRDWLFGCNPWGVSMIVGLPSGGNYPRQPHSFIINYKLGNTTGGLVDGPVYQTIFGSLLGISTDGGTNYEDFQPGNLVYHDSTHDYSTNEPTMDGTASLTYLLSAYETEGREEKEVGQDGTTKGRREKEEGQDVRREAHGEVAGKEDRNVYAHGGIIRTDPSKKRISLIFTADDKADGAESILSTLDSCGIKGSFFFTGKFLRMYPKIVKKLLRHGHYVGSHGYGHLLYASWENRDSLLVTKEEFMDDMLASYKALSKFGITKESAPYFIPSYEYYNSEISSWAGDLGLKVADMTGGDYTNGDYTTPDMEHYYSSDFIMEKVRGLGLAGKLNGQIMLIHLGTEPSRTDKFYRRLPELISMLRNMGYDFISLREAIES